MLGEDDESSFHFDDRCLFVLGILFVLTCASIFLAFFLLEGQGGVSGFSERQSACVEEDWRHEEDAFSL